MSSEQQQEEQIRVIGFRIQIYDDISSIMPEHVSQKKMFFETMISKKRKLHEDGKAPAPAAKPAAKRKSIESEPDSSDDEEDTPIAQEKKRGSVIYAIESQKPVITHHERMQLQSMVCNALEIDDVFLKIKDFCLGNCPADIIPVKNPDGGDSLLWFAVNRNNEIVIIDMIDWLAFPTFFFHQFPCLHLQNNKKKELLYSLSDLLEKNSNRISSNDYLNMHNNLQNLYALL